ncbi:MAG: hypothetical protein Q7J47_04815 [Azoarcus sp.]|nr:hypothetical protein [Azoarcus sp.]
MNATTEQFTDVENPRDLPTALLSAKTGAELLDISIRHWHQLVADRRLPAPIHLGRSARWRLRDVEQALDL